METLELAENKQYEYVMSFKSLIILNTIFLGLNVINELIIRKYVSILVSSITGILFSVCLGIGIVSLIIKLVCLLFKHNKAFKMTFLRNLSVNKIKHNSIKILLVCLFGIVMCCVVIENIELTISNIENNYKPQEFKHSQLFFDGQFYDSYTLIQSLFESANNEIIIIDNYVDRTILDRLVVKNRNVEVIIYTSINTRLLGRDINTFNSQYGGLDVRYTTNVHDRYIIIDQNKIYHLGHSIKDIGKKISTISESDKELIKELLTHLN